MLYYISRFLSASDKLTARKTCIEFKNNVKLIDARIEIMNRKIEKIINGQKYILSRLRLAALCGLDNYTVANIWSWVVMIDDEKPDSLPILRQIGRAIYNNNII